MYHRDRDYLKRKEQLEHLRRKYGTSEDRNKKNKPLTESGRGIDRSKGGIKR